LDLCSQKVERKTEIVEGIEILLPELFEFGNDSEGTAEIQVQCEAALKIVGGLTNTIG
jgi:hypothetical protein